MGELIIELDGYSIYRVHNDVAGVYYLCIPKRNILRCQMILGFSDKNMSALANEEVISIIKEVNDMNHTINNGSVYVVPDIDVSLLEEAALENDNRMYLNILNNKIQPITTDVYGILVRNGIDPKNINQIIQVIERNDRDRKLAGWLAMKLGDAYIQEKDYAELKEEYVTRTKISSLEINNTENLSFNIPITSESGYDGEKLPEETQYMENLNNGEIAPVNYEYDNVPVENKSNGLVKRLTKPQDHSSNQSAGFSSFKFIIVTLLISLVIGVGIAYMIMK